MYELACVCASWGGLHAVSSLLEELPEDLGVAVAIVQHRGSGGARGGLEEALGRHARMPVAEAGDKEPIEPNRVYVAPADYHLLVEPGAFALSTDELVQYARPSADVLFESAADAYGERAIGVVLTGANVDGAAGLAAIAARGGAAIVQEPETAEARAMPEAARRATETAVVLPLAEIGPYVCSLCGRAEVPA